MLTQAVRGRTGDRTSFRAGSLRRNDHTTSVHVLCRMLQCLASARLHAVENYHTFLHGAANSHFKNRSLFFIFQKAYASPRNYTLYARDNDEKDGQPLNK
jgi:hypothetical protein